MIDRNLIAGLINPSFGQDMSRNLQGMFERSRKQKMLKPLFEAEGMFTKASETGDARLAAEQGSKLMQAGQQAGDMDMFRRGQEMRQAAPQVQLKGALQGVENIEKALKREDLAPEARTALEARKAELLQTPGMGEVMAKRRDAQFKALEQKDKMESMQRSEAERKALGMLVAGAPEQDVANAVGANAFAAVQDDWADYQKNRRTAEEEAAMPEFSTSMVTFQSLSPNGQEAVLKAKEVGGNKGALTELKRISREEAETRVKASQDARDGARIVDAETFANKLLLNTDTTAQLFSPSTWGNAFNNKEDVAEWYDSQDGDTQKAVREQVVEAFKQARREVEETGEQRSKEEVISERVNSVLASLGAPVATVTEDTGGSVAGDPRQAIMSQMAELMKEIERERARRGE